MRACKEGSGNVGLEINTEHNNYAHEAKCCDRPEPLLRDWKPENMFAQCHPAEAVLELHALGHLALMEPWKQ